MFVLYRVRSDPVRSYWLLLHYLPLQAESLKGLVNHCCSNLQRYSKRTRNKHQNQNSNSHDSGFPSNPPGLPFIHSDLLRHGRHSSHFFCVGSVIWSYDFSSCSLEQYFYILSRTPKPVWCVLISVCISFPTFIFVFSKTGERKLLFSALRLSRGTFSIFNITLCPWKFFYCGE